MSTFIRTYNPDQVRVNWGGKFNIDGFADGTFITMTRNSPRTEVVVGAKGDNAITKSADFSGMIELTLLQNAPANEYLSYIMSLEDIAGDLIRAIIEVTDPSGSVLSIAQRCHIQEPAPVTLGDGTNAKTWTFYCEDLKYLTVPSGLAGSQATQTAAAAYGALKTVTDSLKTVTR